MFGVDIIQVQAKKMKKAVKQTSSRMKKMQAIPTCNNCTIITLSLMKAERVPNNQLQ
jgi:hypothetical protein